MTGFNSGVWSRKHREDLTPTASPYPVTALPYAIRKAVECLSDRHQISPAICAGTANAAVGFAVQTLADFKMPDGRLRPTSQFHLVIGESGVGKSICFDTFIAPFVAHDKAAEATYVKAVKEHSARLRDWKQQRSDIIKMLAKCRMKAESCAHLQRELDELVQHEPAMPRRRNLLVADTTGAAFIERISGAHQSCSLASDEGAIPFTYLHQYFGQLNLGWDGSSIAVQRKSTGTLIAFDARVSALLMPQPGVFSDFCRRHGDFALDVGAWARFLIVCPPPVENKVYLVDPMSHSTAPIDEFKSILQGLIGEISRRAEAGVTERDVVELDSDARECLITFANEMNSRMEAGGDLSDVKAFAAKAAEHAARMAAGFSYFDKCSTITRDTLERAITIIRHHLLEYVSRFSLAATVPDLVLDAEDLSKHLQKSYWSRRWTSVPMTQLERHGPSKDLRRVDRLLPALQYLQTQGKLELEHRGRKVYVKYRPSLA
ncbi:DUF3987 domain-containing protein [Rhodanobacter sp. Col0626]|uniref:DUF3987 domain-containing protein n=1 Tax=Rhodanobacter sp. Col0626 TaxID=3415679 RepID=UPI003CFB2981